MQHPMKKSLSFILAAVMLLSSLAGIVPTHVHAADITTAGGWLESIYADISGITKNNVTGVSYSGEMEGSLSEQDLDYLVRNSGNGVRIDIPGLRAGTYTLTVTTDGETYTKSGIEVKAHDRSGYAHFNYNEGVGAYNDDGTLKKNAIVLYVTDENKNTVKLTYKGVTVQGIGNILNSAGEDNGADRNDGICELVREGKNVTGKANTNQGILRLLAQDNVPLVIRIIGTVKGYTEHTKDYLIDGLTAWDSFDYGGSEGDNGYMARMQSAKHVTIEGIGAQATIDGWGIHFMAQTAYPELGKSFEIRNLVFRNVPEDCVGVEGVQSGNTITASADHCWVHNCSFYAPTGIKYAGKESDKSEGDGACDFKRGEYFTMDYCYYEGYHKTNLIGSSDSSLQYHITWHHNYYKNCQSRGPLVRNSDIHIYNTVFEGQSDYAMNPRANAYIFSEYNSFINCKDPVQVKSGAVKSYNDTFTSCTGAMQQTVVTDKSTAVSTECKYANFDTNASVSYIPSGNYSLDTDYDTMLRNIKAYAGAMPAAVVAPEDIDNATIPSDRYPSAAVALPYNKSLNNTVFTSTSGTFDNMVVNVGKVADDSVTLGGNANGYDIVFYVDVPVNISMTAISGTYSPVLCADNGKALITGTGSVTNVPAGYYYICSTWDSGTSKYKESKISGLEITAYDPDATPVEPTTPPVVDPEPSSPSGGGDTTTPGTTTPSGGGTTVPAGAYTHNFTTQGQSNSFFTITGNLSESKGSTTYNGENLTKCLKMESDTSITFQAPTEGTLTLVFGGSTDAAGQTVKIDGVAQTVGPDNIYSQTVTAGAHTITKGKPINLFYIVYSSNQPAHECEFGEGVVTTPATCINPGVRTYTCTVDGCGKTKTEPIAATGEHTYSDEWTVDEQPTETTPGSKSRHCTTPGCTEKTDIQSIEPHTHNFGEFVETTPAKCGIAGVQTRTCASCSATDTQEIPALEHNYQFTKTVAPTCTAQGYDLYTCSLCSTTKKDNEVDAKGHTYENGECTVCHEPEPSANLIEAAGHLESAYIEWEPVTDATGYNVYVKQVGASAWTQLDNELIRSYGSYWRADALGLAKGSYILMVVPVQNGVPADSEAFVSAQLAVLAHDRDGYAHSQGDIIGAYNNDGTLKSDAVVVYVTDANKDTVTATIDGTTYTGLQSIVYDSRKSTTPICVRIIGEVKTPSETTGGQIQIKENKAAITVEGVGEDATCNGWGIYLPRANHVEVRNLGFMNNNSNEKDSVTLQSDSTKCWIHNCDFFYGMRGSDNDQEKGDGALDTKQAQYITHSYNHFWDCGKCNLQGASKKDDSDYITYHHNWYDHCDSRCPRVRVANVHVYNNLYDGVSKYCIGAGYNAKIYSDSNYFLNSKSPMRISAMGTDVAAPTMSGETGGMIWAYGNVIESAAGIHKDTEIVDGDTFINNRENPDSYDAQVFDTREEIGFTGYTANIQTAQAAKASVEKYAGRINGGDFKWDFSDPAEDTNYEIIPELKAALVAYKTTLVSVGGNSVEADAPNVEEPTTPPVTHTHEFTAQVAQAQYLKSEATCTSPAVYYKSCSCGEVGTETFTSGYAKEHDYTYHVETTPATCTKTGLKVSTCVCGAKTEEVLPVVDHADLNNDALCDTCGEELGFELDGASIKLEEDMTMYFYMPQTSVSDENCYAVITRTYGDGDPDDVRTVPFASWTSTEDGMYRFGYPNIAAKEMCDSFTVKIYDKNGKQISMPWVDSVSQYLHRGVQKSQKPTERALFVDIANYGAAAQVHFGYDTAHLANSWADEYQNLATPQPDMENKQVKGDNYQGTTLVLESKTILRLYFANVDPTMHAVIRYTDNYNKVHNDTVLGSQFGKNNSEYFIDVDTLAMGDYNCLVTVEVYDANNNLVASATDSIESYLARAMAISASGVYPAAAKAMVSAYKHFHP